MTEKSEQEKKLFTEKASEKNETKIILDLCGGTGSWSRPYKEAGYEVINVTLPDYDVRTFEPPENVYGILAAPPCTMFSFARVHPKSSLRNLKEGMEIVEACLKIIWKCQYKVESNGKRFTSLKFWALENPNGFLKYFLGRPVFEFDPCDFGNPYTKRTHLWGYFNNPIKQNQVSSKYGKFDHLSMQEIKSISNAEMWKDTKNRQALRSITPSGFANAFFEANR